MINYNLFSKHYDEIMGDRAENAAELQNLINKYHPRAKTILELACGTGSVLQHFAKRYGVYGLDISPGMLSRARKKLPAGKFSQQDMTKFKLSKEIPKNRLSHRSLCSLRSKLRGITAIFRDRISNSHWVFAASSGV